jgi:hypothetical protein
LTNGRLGEFRALFSFDGYRVAQVQRGPPAWKRGRGLPDSASALASWPIAISAQNAAEFLGGSRISFSRFMIHACLYFFFVLFADFTYFSFDTQISFY